MYGKGAEDAIVSNVEELFIEVGSVQIGCGCSGGAKCELGARVEATMGAKEACVIVEIQVVVTSGKRKPAMTTHLSRRTRARHDSGHTV